MTVQNESKYLAECIQSIQEQSFSDWELIVVDDHSKDDTWKKLQDFARLDARIKPYHNRLKGIVPALDLAFSHANGEFITRMDGDDKMPKNKLSLFHGVCSQYGPCVVTGKVLYFSEEPISEGYLRYQEWLNGLLEKDDMYSSIYRECIIASGNWMVHRSFFEECPFSELSYPEDYDLVFKWYKKNLKIIAIPEVTHLWREHSERTSRTSEHYQQKAFFKLKTQEFVKNELRELNTVQVIGFNRKSKLILEFLRAEGILYELFDIKSNLAMGVKTIDQLNSNKLSILANWPSDNKQQEQILKWMKENNFRFGENLWLF